MVNSYLEQVRTCQDGIYELQRKARSKAIESNDFLDEEEILYLDLINLINQAKNEGLEPSEAEELKTILTEVEQSRQTVRQDIVNIFAGW
ncbi:hypothetical protein [endosymbiont GvMRE of Glomus versiforme]|uniref:hypothetical protein n=1 Tax=endosymbiont GvMRE of Glomus versiforme TaxID=2039283 RepID=UPI000EE135EA|nr:hypothetical protein [endosymbiont GvMRE of Glomus versiforme]RHZ37234.1 hypothetical protein GvMRE_I1g265 [endosymbiont GvMRE of Glomus versiforme]